MKWISALFMTVFFLGLSSPLALSQDVLDDNLNEDELVDAPIQEKGPALVTETIKTISLSQKIFILTNKNQAFGNGDFVSLLLQDKLVCRALVAKVTEANLSGIKIVKIYSLDLWKQLGPGKDVQVIRGDDSYYAPQKAVAKEEKKKPVNKVQTEDDLYNSTTLAEGDDPTLEDNAKRNIKTDNLLALNIGLIDGVDDTGATKRYSHLNGSWAYQIGDNIWTEFSIGSNTIRDLPVLGVDTQLVAYSARIKYTISAPFYSYVQPYVGYQVISSKSPGAQTPAEIALVALMKKSRVVVGATILRRIVPGWFARVDFGSDLINGGLLLEF
jgi:hypothetical protein